MSENEEQETQSALVPPPQTPRLQSSLSTYSYSLRKPLNYSRKKPKRRVVSKNGDSSVLHSRMSRRRRLELLQDIVTTLVKIRCHWTLTIFTAVLVVSWLAFAVLWWLICYTHGDFEPDHLPEFQNVSNWKPCVLQAPNFMSCFLFSIETQHTVGYGIRAPTGECPEAIFLNVMQCTVGVILQGFMSGIIFAKMTLPKKRSQTLLFSRDACVCLRDGVLCLMFRVGDVRKEPVIDPQIKAFLVKTKRTREGELLRQQQTALPVSADACADDLFFIWPMVVVHRMEHGSPLFDVTPGSLLYDCFEIVVVLDGVIQSTGQSMQARTSYTATEILWGRRFQQVLEFDEEWKEHRVNFSKFHETDAVETPCMSAKELFNHKLQRSLI